MKAVLDFLATPTGLGYAALALVIVIGWLMKKKPFAAKLAPIVVACFNQVEKMIPDNPEGDKWVNKLDRFLQEFVKKYEERYGKPPSKTVKTLAVDMVENLVFEKNKTNNEES